MTDDRSQSMNPADRDDHDEASRVRNEFEEPGANYPDTQKQVDEEPRIAGVEEDLPVEQRGPTQDGPRQDVHLTNDMERLNGIVAQSRVDLTGESVDVIEKSLRRRLDDTGIALDDDELASLARDIADGKQADQANDTGGF